jgi:Ni,Fe-hydrogenase III small subunit/ferredoxin
MLNILKARWQQGHRTMYYPDGPAPEMPERFTGRPVLTPGPCPDGCKACATACPVGAIAADKPDDGIRMDLGRCIFCMACRDACPRKAIDFGRDPALAASSRDALVVSAQGAPSRAHPDERRAALLRKLLERSLKLRQVSAAGCNACEADTNVLGTLAWDLGRFGMQFVASPRHADGILVTGPVSQNMKEALLKTYDAVAEPKIVIATGACAISGGIYAGHAEACDGVSGILPVDLYIPGCPPHPMTILQGLLRFVGRIS